MTDVVLERADIQGDILRAYGNAYDRTTYVFVSIADPAGGRAWLGGLEVTTDAERPREAKPRCALNVALTYPGLVALGVPDELLDTFSDEFREGMAARAAQLGDRGANAPEHWEGGLADAHVLVTLNALTESDLDAALATLHGSIEAAAGVSVAFEQHAQLLDQAREHFGFADGFAQPAVAGASDDRAAGGGLAQDKGKWRALAPGEFILGYPDEDTLVDPQKRLPSAPRAPLGRSGTYMVWRKLRQHVGLFRRTLHDAAHGYPGGEEQLAAKIVGRWRNGTPLELSPDAEIAGFDGGDPANNAFRYLDQDVDGARCPLGAHIRRSNPRDGLGWPDLGDSGLLSFRHRIIRRGMPYGPPLPDGVLDDDDTDRGLVFVCFNASISRQFEGVQLQWLNDGNAFHLGHDSDYLLGNGGGTLGTGKMTVQAPDGRAPYFLTPQPDVVTTRGGVYLFVPGVAALRALAGAEWGAA